MCIPPLPKSPENYENNNDRDLDVADEIELGAIDFEDTDFEDWVGFYRSFV
jgi:hypothetical protein